MKILKYFTFAVLLAALTGCGKLEKVTTSDSPTAPVLLAHDPIEITADNLNDMTTFKWERSDFGFPDAAEYTLLMTIGTGEPSIVSSAHGNSLTIKLEDLNKVLIKAGAPIGEQIDARFHLTANISEAFAHPVTSAPVIIPVIAYGASASFLYIAGNFTFPSSWSPGDPLAPRLTAPGPGDDFEGMVDLTTAGDALEFKFCAKPSWDGPNYGGTINMLDPNGGNITDLSSGYYRLVVNPEITKVKNYLLINTIGMIGDATPGGWSTETKMTYSQSDNTWNIASVALTNGLEFKLRINDDWSFAIGGSLQEAAFDKGNIPIDVPTGNYKVTFKAGVFPYQIVLKAL